MYFPSQGLEINQNHHILSDGKNKTYYLKDYIVKATKLGYELLRNNDGEVIFKSSPANFILLTKKIDDDDYFPPWAVGQIV